MFSHELKIFIVALAFSASWLMLLRKEARTYVNFIAIFAAVFGIATAFYVLYPRFRLRPHFRSVQKSERQNGVRVGGWLRADQRFLLPINAVPITLLSSGITDSLALTA